MRLRNFAFILAALLICTAFCSADSFTGTFTNDNQVQFFTFVVGADGTDIVLQTFSFDGGVNGNGVTIPSGGFDPVLELFAVNVSSPGFEPGKLLALNDDSDEDFGTSDSLIRETLPAGQYLVALTESGNCIEGTETNGAVCSETSLKFDVFFLNAGFTGTPIVDFDGNSPDWALDIVGADQASVVGVPTVPEPSSVMLFGSGLAGLLASIRRRMKI